MKVAILAGGLGTRFSEETKFLPKPMIKIGKYPILIHIINLYLKSGFNEFYILMGYKSNVIKKYFKNFKKLNKPFIFKLNNNFCKITLLETGKRTMTGGRLKKMIPFLKNDEKFMFTYGDGIANVDLKKLKKFHLKHNKLITVTAVRPQARFGELKINNSIVTAFKEKPQTRSSWINGGFFVADKKFLNFIDSPKTILEKKPLEIAAKKKQLMAFKHIGFWKCMDTYRDKIVLEKLHKKKFF
ncbi:MAG: glucose-1-phosphate cytidylyltransferase [Pelagibacteraceae bacterium]|jgi:glucose-1-phosphate cytidylyltransferase|nr:glucose-1-phosphate cytidylyltransferase [Pelagibacteraceae bacterium]